MDVVVWLRSLGLGKYEAAFRENEIDETVLPSLTHEILKDHECVQLSVEIGEYALRLRGARILNDHVEQIGDGSRRRLHLLSEERRLAEPTAFGGSFQGPAQALV
jgi:hypothetical protein